MNAIIPKDFNIEIERIHHLNSTDEQRTLYHGIHGFKTHPYMVTAVIKDDVGRIVAIGRSFCSPLDQPVRRVGTDKALERAKREFFMQYPVTGS